VSAPDKKGQPGVVAELFPFSEYFADAPQPLFKSGASYAEDMEVGGGGVCVCVCRRLGRPETGQAAGTGTGQNPQGQAQDVVDCEGIKRGCTGLKHGQRAWLFCCGYAGSTRLVDMHAQPDVFELGCMALTLIVAAVVFDYCRLPLGASVTCDRCSRSWRRLGPLSCSRDRCVHVGRHTCIPVCAWLTCSYVDVHVPCMRLGTHSSCHVLLLSWLLLLWWVEPLSCKCEEQMQKLSRVAAAAVSGCRLTVWRTCATSKPKLWP
jgi:hypothetical protein